jgi:D-xylonolactonase
MAVWAGLLYSCVLNGGVFCVDRQGNVTTVFAYRKGIRGMSVDKNAGLIVSGRNISWKSVLEGETITVLEKNEVTGLIGFNDITTDEAGRIYAGSLRSSPVFEDGREPRPGDLYLIELDGSAPKVAFDIQLTNGLAFSPDGRTPYHSDSARDHINCYSVTADDSLGEKQLFAETEIGSPDGLVVSEDGRVWVALPGGSGVGVYHPNGRFDQLIEIPEPMCTSVCFGGDDLKDLYIVSGSRGSESDRAGAVYVQRVDVAGLAVPLARVSVSA